MAIGQVNPGYMGYAAISGITNPIRFSDANITVRQEVNAPDLIMGHWDHNAYVYGPIEVGGSMSGPVTENFVGAGANSLWAWATDRGNSDGCGTLDPKTIDLIYYCDRSGGNSRKSRTFQGMLVNSLTFSCAAGDIAQWSVDVLGTGTDSNNNPTTVFGSLGSNQTDEEKLLTWDQVQVAVTAGDQDIGTLNNECFSNFEFTINNNLETVYAICSGSSYYPFDIVPGLRTLTGSLSVYNIPEVLGEDNYSGFLADQQGSITFTLGVGNDYTFNVRFHRVEPASSVGPIISTVGFTGVGWQSTLDGN